MAVLVLRCQPGVRAAVQGAQSWPPARWSTSCCVCRRQLPLRHQSSAGAGRRKPAAAAGACLRSRSGFVDCSMRSRTAHARRCCRCWCALQQLPPCAPSACQHAAAARLRPAQGWNGPAKLSRSRRQQPKAAPALRGCEPARRLTRLIGLRRPELPGARHCVPACRRCPAEA